MYKAETRRFRAVGMGASGCGSGGTTFMQWIKRAIGKESAPKFSAPIAPDAPFYAIGDIHGHYPALEALLDKLDERDPKPAICVGDYVDRGENSARVLKWLHRINMLYPEFFVCLMGNHEEMLLKFIEDPEANERRWLRFGGLQTLLSFGIQRAAEDSPTLLRDRLVDAMGHDLLEWLTKLPLTWQSGNVLVCHAGLDPNLSPMLQARHSLLWGHPDFGKMTRKDDLWVVHGHTIVETPVARNGVISVDTGAYATGVLTAAEISTGHVEFIRSSD